LRDKYLHYSLDRKKSGGRKQEDIVPAMMENFSSLSGESRRIFEDEGIFGGRNHFLTTNQQKGLASRTLLSFPCKEIMRKITLEIDYNHTILINIFRRDNQSKISFCLDYHV
jgi:hypothetical protein